jgi:predicted alpha/beta superfamily hydrolase
LWTTAQTLFSRIAKEPMDTNSNTPEKLAAGAAGELRKHEKFRSRFLSSARDLIVYVPPGYASNSQERFSVLYMQDGQNLFDPETSFVPGMYWRMGETAGRLIAEGAMRPLIIVGIYNGKQRIREYTPTPDKKLGGGGADRYARAVLEDIKPFIESEYRTLAGPANTGLGGSSLGALFTMYLGLRAANVFGRLAVLSPSVWWNQRAIVNFVARSRVGERPRIWLDTGTQEAAHTVEHARLLRDALVNQGWQFDRDLHYEEFEGGQHNEAAWAQRVGPCLQFLFPALERQA